MWSQCDLEEQGYDGEGLRALGSRTPGIGPAWWMDSSLALAPLSIGTAQESRRMRGGCVIRATALLYVDPPDERWNMRAAQTNWIGILCRADFPKPTAGGRGCNFERLCLLSPRAFDRFFARPVR